MYVRLRWPAIAATGMVRSREPRSPLRHRTWTTPTARRFETGTAPYINAFAARANSPLNQWASIAWSLAGAPVGGGPAPTEPAIIGQPRLVPAVTSTTRPPVRTRTGDASLRGARRAARSDPRGAALLQHRTTWRRSPRPCACADGLLQRSRALISPSPSAGPRQHPAGRRAGDGGAIRRSKTVMTVLGLHCGPA